VNVSVTGFIQALPLSPFSIGLSNLPVSVLFSTAIYC